MPKINDKNNPASSNTNLTLVEVLNSVAFILKKITGKDSWKLPPDFSLADLAQNQGDKGDKGDTGATGAQGLQGDKGDKGDTGASGAAGIQGAKGDVGAQGLQGDKGDTGASGAAGTQGLKGDKGDTGLQGIQGIQGVQGDTVTQIITSASIPSNPTQGLLWNEIDTNNNLVETWIRNGNKWVSGIKESSFTIASITSSANYYFPLDSSKDIYFTFYNRFFLSGGVSVGSSFAVACTVYSADIVISSVPSTLFQLTYQNQTAGQVVTARNVINKSFIGVGADNFRVIITRTGSPPACGFGFGIDYQYIRK